MIFKKAWMRARVWDCGLCCSEVEGRNQGQGTSVGSWPQLWSPAWTLEGAHLKPTATTPHATHRPAIRTLHFLELRECLGPFAHHLRRPTCLIANGEDFAFLFLFLRLRLRLPLAPRIA